MSHAGTAMTEAELVRHATYYRASPALQGKIRTSLRFVRPPGRFDGWARGFAMAATVAAVAVVSWKGALLTAGSTGDDALAGEVTTAHVRSLIAEGHLHDVLSTDRHTVKPWFSGKLDFAPPVEDFADAGLPLTGGRLDYLAGRPVAALTYAHQKHVVNLFVWPAQMPRDMSPVALSRQGYSMEHWTEGGMSYWLVADVEPRQLASLANVIRKVP
jgi:anti-sigma factor RsiW